jgi:hypothetical protein
MKIDLHANEHCAFKGESGYEEGGSCERHDRKGCQGHRPRMRLRIHQFVADLYLS